MHQPEFQISREQAETLLRGIESGLALPTQWYSDPAIFAAERKHILRRAWHFATHTGELPQPGDVYVRQIAGVPIVLVRGADGFIRGFLNICRHRGHPVVIETGNRKTLQCHYHAWTYDLDGSLRSAPRSAGDPAFVPAELGLVPVQTHVWGPMVWVNLDVSAPSFPGWIDGLPQHLAARGLNVDDHVFAFDNEWRIDANWKVFQDNTIECYHCPTTHPELSRVLDMKPATQQMEVGGRYWIHHRIPFRQGITSGITFKAVPGEQLYYYYNWIFPGTYLQHAGRGFDIGTLDIVDVDHIRFRHICFLPADTPPRILAKGKAHLDADATIEQDVVICNRVQQNHATGLAPTGRMLLAPELLLRHFQRLIVELVAAPETERAAPGGPSTSPSCPARSASDAPS